MVMPRFRCALIVLLALCALRGPDALAEPANGKVSKGQCQEWMRQCLAVCSGLPTPDQVSGCSANCQHQAGNCTGTPQAQVAPSKVIGNAAIRKEPVAGH